MLIMHYWAFIYASLEDTKDLTVYDQKSYQIFKKIERRIIQEE